jgi:hypothetical protein
LPEETLVAKFTANAARSVPDPWALVTLWRHLDSVDDVRHPIEMTAR